MQKTEMYNMCTFAAALVLSGGCVSAPITPTPELPQCGQPIGTVALAREEKIDEEARLQRKLPPPHDLVETMIQKSNCFTIVARGDILNQINPEHNVIAPDNPLVAAEYIIKPRITRSNVKNLDVEPTGSIPPGDVPAGSTSQRGRGIFDRVYNAIKPFIEGSSYVEVNTNLTLIDTCTGTVITKAEGHAVLGNLDVVKVGTGMANHNLREPGTIDMGPVIADAFVDAYKRLVDKAQEDKAKRLVDTAHYTTLTAR